MWVVEKLGEIESEFILCKCKMDAFKKVALYEKEDLIEECRVLNARTTLIDGVNQGTKLYLDGEYGLEEYGEIKEIATFLVTIIKPNKDVIEFRKEGINERLIGGQLKLNKY